MGRPISQNLQELLDADSCETQSTLELRMAKSQIRRYATDDVTIGGQEFVSDVRFIGEIVQSIVSNVDRTTARFQNVDKQIGLKMINGDLDGATAIVGRLYRSEKDQTKQEWVELFRGQTKPIDTDPVMGIIEIVDDLVAAGYSVADRTLKPECPLVFKSFECGYTGDAPPCSHNLETCRILYRFAGMETKIEIVAMVPGDVGGGGQGGGIGGTPSGGGISGGGSSASRPGEIDQ